jgi:predicted ribosome quality control (RQC) complex YloA/Tae2 family protein
MIQYYRDLQNQVKNIREKSLGHGQIQKLYSTAYYISFSIRAPGKTWHMYFGRGSGKEGVWLHESAPPSELRRRDNFLEYFRRHMSSCSFLDLSLDKSDRIVKFSYQKFGKEQSFLWFWKGRKLYFLHHYQDQPEGPFRLLLSWKGKAFIPDYENTDLFSYFDEIGRSQDINQEIESSDFQDMSTLLDNELKAASLKGLSSMPSFLQRKKVNIQEDLRKAQQWEKLQAIIHNDVGIEDIYELKVDDQKIKFEGDLNPYERRNLIFEKIKKLKRGEKILKERLEKVEDQLSGVETETKKQSVIPIIKPIWGEEKKSLTGAAKVIQDEYKVYSYEGCSFGVGLNSHGNDQLRSKWANKDDHWLHLDGLKSTHVIIKIPTNQSISSEILNMGASIVAHFSHFKDEWIPIIYTQVKNLKGVSGSAGMVTYKKEKHLRCPRVNLDPVLREE